MPFNCSIEPSLSLHVLNNIDTLNKANTDKKNSCNIFSHECLQFKCFNSC